VRPREASIGPAKRDARGKRVLWGEKGVYAWACAKVGTFISGGAHMRGELWQRVFVGRWDFVPCLGLPQMSVVRTTLMSVTVQNLTEIRPYPAA